MTPQLSAELFKKWREFRSEMDAIFNQISPELCEEGTPGESEGNAGEFKGMQGKEREELAAQLLASIHSFLGTEVWTVGELLDHVRGLSDVAEAAAVIRVLARPEYCIHLGKKPSDRDKTLLGIKLARLPKENFSGFELQNMGKDRRNSTCWRVVLNEVKF